MGTEERKKGSELPLRTLHEFLFELDREWNSFRTGSILSILTSAILLILLLIPRLFVVALRRFGPVLDQLVFVALVVALAYGIYLQYRQHLFYSRWERRMGILLHMEDELLGGDKES
jgi:hypothetical protein